MRSTFFGLNTALKALVAQRKALEVSAHNVANANTEGYTRQDALLVAAYPYTTPAANRSAEAGQIGTGVEVNQIRRMRDNFLDYQIRSQLGALGSWETTRDYLEQVEAVVNEPSDSGVNALLGKFWGAWHDLSSNPDSYAAKAAVVQNGAVLVDVIRRNADQLDILRRQADQEIGLRVEDVNIKVEKIAELNRQIQQVEIAGDEANDLKDQRDLLLDELSRKIPVTYNVQPDVDGRSTQLVLTLGGRTLIDGSSFNKLAPGTDGTGKACIVWEDGFGGANTPVDAGTGELSSLLKDYNVVLNPAASSTTDPPGGIAWRLDELAKKLISTVNSVYDASGVTKFFDGTSAKDIAVNASLVADPALVSAGDPALAGDGSKALAIAKVQTTRVDFNGDGSADASIGEWYQEMVSKLGIDMQQAKGMATNQKLLVDHLKKNREAASGVSLDEEATNMVRFERAYQAAARTMTAMDEMLDTIINGMGIVGR